MASSVPGAPDTADDKMRLERNAGLIMGTNSSSIVSKRSVERLYFPQPHFYKYFVRKSIRRSPSVNRGYWLRMRAIDWAVRQFLEKPSDQRKIVINLGCGYDPLPFQWMSREGELCKDTKFIDIDYDELLSTKVNIVKNTPQLESLLSSTEESARQVDEAILLDCPNYAVIGCDLRNVPRLGRLLKSVVDIENCVVLCIAEVSITYMHTDKADDIIAWTATLCNDVTFCLLEQGSPDRSDNPFTATMVNHFKKIGTPLHSIFEYPDAHAAAQRFDRLGFAKVDAQNLWQLWADPKFLSPSQRMALDQVEPFDEWEEFALYGSHYLLVIARNQPDLFVVEEPRGRRDSVASLRSDISARTVSPVKPEAQWFALKYCKDDGDDTKRHHASSYSTPDQDAIAVLGGISPKGRLSSTLVCRSSKTDAPAPFVLPPEIGARCCHTVSVLANGQNILVGGRGSPAQPMKDCWLQTGSTWSRIHDLPAPRYRHRTVRAVLPEGVHGAVVFGGKTGPSQVATDVLLWHPGRGWSVLRSLHDDPVPRFGASFICLGFNHGILFGGMRQDGIICQGFWRWRLVTRDNHIAGIAFRRSHALDASVGSYPWFARLGASYGLVRDELLIIGGVAKSGCIPKSYEYLSIMGSFSAFKENETEMQLRLSCCEPTMPSDYPRPFLIGHSAHGTKDGNVVLVCGGATCFAFGNYFNSGIWVLHEREAGLFVDWKLVETQHLPLPIERKKEDDEEAKIVEQ